MTRPLHVDEVFADPLSQPAPAAVRLMNDRPRPVMRSRPDLTEARYGELFAAGHGDEFRYDRSRRLWMICDPSSSIWRPDATGELTRRLIAFARQQQEASIHDVPDPETRREVLAFLLRMERRHGLENIDVVARSLEPFALGGNEWDSQLHLLGTRAGILNLNCPDCPLIKDHLMYVTKTIGCAYDLDARCPRWLTFLDEVFVGDVVLISWIQKAVGYSLSGWTREQVMFLLHGSGSNGKSVFLETIAYTFGSYAWNVPFSLFEQRGRTSINDDVAALVGYRFVTASETADGVKLNEPRLKMLTGQDRVTARHLYGKYFEFEPQAKFWLSTNHLPAVRDRSHGFWRRIRIVPFLARFDGHTRDNRLRETLRSEASGILLWALDGCQRWRREGLGQPPDVVEAATEKFQTESDPLAGFLEDCCVLRDDARGGAGALLEAYGNWVERTHLPSTERLTRIEFGGQLASRFEKKATSAGKFWLGVGLKVLE